MTQSQVTMIYKAMAAGFRPQEKFPGFDKPWKVRRDNYGPAMVVVFDTPESLTVMEA